MSYGTLPGNKFFAVTPSDTAKLTVGGVPIKTRAIYVGGAGNLTVDDEAGNAVTFTAVAAGSVLPIATDQVNSTATTATSIVALY